MKQLSQEGAIIVSAGALVGYNTIPKIARAAGIPYTTLLHDLTGDFGSMTAYRLRAVIRVTKMKSEQVAELMMRR